MHRYVRAVPAGLLIVLCLILTSCVTLVMAPPEQGGSAPVINVFEANPGDITAGTVSMIRWDVSNATSVTIDQNIGTVTPSGSTSVSPGTTTTYTLTATNTTGSARRGAIAAISSCPAFPSPAGATSSTGAHLRRPSTY